MKNSKMSLNPPNVDNFIQAAEPKQSEQEYDKPWEDPSIQENELSQTRLAMPAKYRLKLKYLSKKSEVPQQKIMRYILCPGIDRLLEDLEKNGYFTLT